MKYRRFASHRVGPKAKSTMLFEPKLVTKHEVCGEDWRKYNPHNCPVRERTGDGTNVGACWHYLHHGDCPVHGQIYERLAD